MEVRKDGITHTTWTVSSTFVHFRKSLVSRSEKMLWVKQEPSIDFGVNKMKFTVLRTRNESKKFRRMMSVHILPQSSFSFSFAYRLLFFASLFAY